MEIQKYTFGGINFLLIFKAFKLEHLQKELEFYKSKFENSRSDVTISFVEDLKKLGILKGGETRVDNSTYFYKSRLFVGEGYFYVMKYPFSYLVRKNGKKYEIFISKRQPQTLLEKFHRYIVRNNFLSPSFITDQERLASNIIYDFVNPFLQLMLIENKGTFVHASCVSDEKGAFLIPALGGVGKTTLSSEFVLEKGFKFVADDLTILRDKKCHTNLTHLFVYPYNKKLVSNVKLSFFDKLKWNFYRMLKVPPLRLRRSPLVVYGKENVSQTPKKIKNIFFLEKGNFKSLNSSKIDYNLIHSKMKNILLDEFKSLIDLIILVNSVKPGIFPDLEDFLEKVSFSLRYNLEGADSRIVQIPLEKEKIYPYIYNLYKKSSK
jgi:hypothetical protein